MEMYDILDKKKKCGKFTKEEIEFVVNNFTNGIIPDYQMSALLMAICINGMTSEETWFLTEAMMRSGEIVDLSKIDGIKVDKHSTGGVGDKTTLIVAPLMAAAGLKVPKMSGRALGHTGGTVDKLESIPGFKIERTKEEFINQVNEVGLCIAGQTAEIAPADKKIYALRDVTATVDNVSLVASSIMSKKLASGASYIVLDVKTGNGSFAGSFDNAVVLANEMVKIGKNMSRGVCAVISDMNQPLGRAVGNSLEVMEAVETLRGKGEEDVRELSVELAAQMLIMTKEYNDISKARKILNEKIDDGSAYKKLLEMVEYQGGDISYLENISKFKLSSYTEEISLGKKGYVHKIDCKEVGMSALLAGGGRVTKEDKIDYGAGIYIHKKLGDVVGENDSIATVYASSEEKLAHAVERLKGAYSLSNIEPVKIKLIYKIID